MRFIPESNSIDSRGPGPSLGGAFTPLGGSLFRPFILGLALATAGCTTITADGHGRSLLVVGVARVVIPDAKGSLSAVDVKALGIGWDGGPFLGWKAGNWITADPAQCQLVIVIRSPAQAENAAKVIQALEGQNPCIADFTHSLRR